MPLTKVPGYSPTFFTGGYLKDPVSGKKNPVNGILQDPGVSGQVLGDYSPIPAVPPLTSTTPPPPPTPKMPSLSDLITGDPTYQAKLAATNAAISGSRDALRDAIRQAVLQSGFDLSGGFTGQLSEFGGDIDPATLAAAQANPLSTKAQLDEARTNQLSDLNYRLAARGMLGSGSSAVGATDIQKNYDVAQNSAMNDLLNALRGNVSDYLGTRTSAQSDLNSTMEQVAERLAQQTGSTGTDTTDTGTNAPAGGGSVSTGPVSWGGQNFTTKAALSRWLSARGASYATWAQNHPAAAARLA